MQKSTYSTRSLLALATLLTSAMPAQMLDAGAVSTSDVMPSRAPQGSSTYGYGKFRASPSPSWVRERMARQAVLYANTPKHGPTRQQKRHAHQRA